MEYYVNQIGECPHCGGSGLISNPLWKEYYMYALQHPMDLPMHDGEEYENYLMRLDGVRRAKMLEWWRNRTGENYITVHDLPVGQELCEECEGKGRINRTVLLVDALIDLGVLQEV